MFERGRLRGDRSRWFCLPLCGALLASAPLQAQAPPGDASLNDLVIEWLQGNYATPVVCTFDGASRRGLRRVLIAPAARRGRLREATVRFVDLEAEGASRCISELDGPVPNITGSMVVRHPTQRPRPTAMRDFKTELKRKRGFELDVVSGQLELQAVGSQAPSETLDLSGGHLRIHVLRKGDDGLRVLQDLPSPRQVRIEFEAGDGRVISFPASLARPGDRRRPGPR